jgi:hypothetical protein
MAINTKIATDIAFKRLAGNKSFTNPSLSAFGELIGSNIQSSADILFGEKIPTNPGAPGLSNVDPNAFDTASNADGVGVVQLIDFELRAIPSSIYDADAAPFGSFTEGAFDEADSGASATTHSFALHFPSDYESNNGSNAAGVSQNPRAGTGFFKDGFALTGSQGSVQIIPALYGTDYTPVIFNAAGTNLEIDASAQDFYLDTFAGVLTRQDGGDGVNEIPTKLRAYVYIGKMVSESLADTFTTPSFQAVTDVGSVTTNNVGISGSLSVSSSLVDFTGATSVTASLISASGLLIHNDSTIEGGLDVALGLTVGNSIVVGSDVEVGGNLTVNGSFTSINTTNTQVEDQFILLGSASNSTLNGTRDGGIVVARHNQGPSTPGIHGTALFYDASRQSWGLTGATGSHDDITNLVADNATNPDSQVTLATIDINAGAPITVAGGTVVRPRPLVGGDNSSNDGQFALGQMYVDTNDTANGGLYIYLPS